ncbi:Peroxide-responsive repressor PerR [Poriferisphaera corsica]|uniref:Peroxide-responsive repressor PerR n=1 Tax=Poriferisphaera corsica TaxID=2528020 RepID=A0A517YR04_9BACT|nr:transcriptional repressor [Poriferisphaera corsica]QDU32657.1 Peroxide-responsive repressor PerR [Poriferisphaera corsica]
MSRKNKSKLSELFSRHGLRCTKQRVALYEALQEARTHPTADELYRSLCDHVPAMSLATVYNTLEAFCDVGLAHKMPGTGVNGSARYDADRGDEHLHVRCRVSGKISDIPDDMSRKILDAIPEELLEQIEQQMGYKIDQVRIELVGENKQAISEMGAPEHESERQKRRRRKCLDTTDPEYQKGLAAAMNPVVPRMTPDTDRSKLPRG